MYTEVKQVRGKLQIGKKGRREAIMNSALWDWGCHQHELMLSLSIYTQNRETTIDMDRYMG